MGSLIHINSLLRLLLCFKILDHVRVEADILFPKDDVVERICMTGPFPQTVDTTQIVAAQCPPITYSTTGNTTLFAVNQDTGEVSVLACGATSNVSNFTLHKMATDKTGSTAVMTITLTMIEPQVVIKLCPKMQEFDTREIAPVGEEIGQLNCGNYVPNMFEKDKTMISVSGGYVPFNVTTLGIVIVASPLHFRNSIEDIIIFNVTIRKPLNNTRSNECKVVQTRLVLRITVLKAACPTGWTYQPRSNIILDFPQLMSISPASVEHCKETCSTFNTTPCNSFAYDLVMKSCDLFNETDISMPKLVHRKLGTFMYRKVCQTGTFPKYALRQLKKEIDTFHEFTTSLSERVLQGLLKFTTETNTTNEERRVTVDVMTTVVSNTTFTNSSNNGTIKYLKLQMELLRLIKIFDTLLESLISGVTTETDDISVKTAYVHILKTQQSRNDSSLELSAGGSVSRVAFPNYYNTSVNGSEQLLLVTGALTLPDKALTNGSSVGKDDNNQSLVALAGHMVSVNVRTYNSLFPSVIQLDVFTSTIPGETIERTCVYLDLDGHRPVWRDTGCWVVAYNESHVRCQCNHLTNFAVLMQVRQFQVSKIHRASLEVVTVIGCCCSIASLSTTILILLWLRLHTDRYVLLMNLSAALILAQVVFLTGIDAVKSKSVCRFVAILLHYLYLGVFTLMLAEGIYLYQKLHRAFSTDTSITMFLLLGWGSPFIVLSLSLITNIDGYGTKDHCWLSTDGAIWAFVGPAITIISINTVILVSIIQTFLSIKLVTKKTDSEKFKASLKVTAVLLPLLGITWMFGVIAVNNSTVIFQYAFALFNSLQGFFIFLFHIVFNDEKTLTVSRGAEIVLPINDLVPRSTGKHPFGFLLESETPVGVYVENSFANSSDGSAIIPESHLSNEYILISWRENNAADEFAVVGTTDETNVEVTWVDGEKFKFTLDRYQQYFHKASRDITGAFISSSANVAVFAGNVCTNVLAKHCDHLYEQMPPIRDLQTEFIVSYPYPRHNYVIRIMAIEDNTEINLSNGTSLTLNRNAYSQYQFNNVAIAITTTKRVMVAAYTLGGTNRRGGLYQRYGGSMLIVAGISQSKSEYSVHVPRYVALCMLMITYPTYMSSADNIRRNHQPFLAKEQVKVVMPGMGEYTVLYFKLPIGSSSSIYTTDGTPFGIFSKGRCLEAVSHCWEGRCRDGTLYVHLYFKHS